MTSAATAAEPSTGAAERVEVVLGELAEGRPVVVLGDEDRADEADLVFAAECATPSLVAFAVRRTSGFLCVAITDERADELRLPPMTSVNNERHGTVYAVTVDAKCGVSTGISATDRARTASLLAAAGTTASELVRPGHVVPLRANASGVLARRGHTEAAVDLTAMAGLRPAGGLCELVSNVDPTRLARGSEARAIAREHRLAVVSVDDVATYRMQRQRVVERGAEARLPLAAGTLQAIAYRSSLDDHEHVALVPGHPGGGGRVPVHVHRECALSVVATTRCVCRTSLDAAIETVARRGEGVVLFVRSGPGLRTCERSDAREEQKINAVAESMLADLGVPEWNRISF